MPAKKTEKSWEDIGKDIGTKFEKAQKDGKCSTKSFCFDNKSDSGFFGRTLFIVGLLIALKMAGVWVFPWYVWTLVIAGFAFLKF